MNRRIVATLIGCLCLSAQAVNVNIPVSITATLTNKATTALSNVAATDTNFVELAGMFITVPAATKADITLSTQFGGKDCVLDVQTVKNPTAASVVMFRVPKYAGPVNRASMCDNFLLVGTNAMLSVQQAAFSTNSYFENVPYALTNAWSIQLLIKQ